MKKIIVILSLFFLISCNNDRPAYQAELDSVLNGTKIDSSASSIDRKSVYQSYKQSQEKALAAIRKEPKVKDATITDANVLYVSVKDDGTRRDGYAQYLVSVLQEYNTNVELVKVVKFGSMNDPKRDNAFGILLGEAYIK